MSSRPMFKDEQFEMFRLITNPHRGRVLQFDGDMRQYPLQRDQRWEPRIMPTESHPAKIGDLVTLDSQLSRYLNLKIGFVPRVRCFQEYRDNLPVRQVELSGLACRWFGIGHFEEYDWRRVPDIGFRMYESVLCLGS